MVLSLVGTFPVSTVNVGLGASLSGLDAANAKLSFDVSKFQAALTAQGTITASFPPNIPGLTAVFTLGLDPAALAAAFANWLTLNADANVDFVAELAIIEAQLTIVENLAASFTAGLDASGLFAWTYAGRAAGFGTRLKGATRYGFGGISPVAPVSGIIVATDLFASWGSFSAGIHTGTSDDEDLGQTTSEERLRALGSLSGKDVAIGVAGALQPLSLLLAELRGRKATLEALIQLSLGVNLPDPTIIVNAGLSVDLAAALDNLVNVQADVTGDISGLQAKITANANLAASITTQLSAGGLSLWSYSGPGGEFGAAFEPEIEGGLPGVDEPDGPAYGLAIACAVPAQWASFGQIFKTS